MSAGLVLRVRSLSWFRREAVALELAGLGTYERKHQTWLTGVERLSAVARALRARRLRARGAVVYRERLREHVKAEMEFARAEAERLELEAALAAELGDVEPEELLPIDNGKRVFDPETGELFEVPELGEGLRMPEGEADPETGEMVNSWHFARATGIERRFARMRRCHEGKSYLVRTCGHWATRYRLGCNQRSCNRCRKSRAKAIQKPFNWAREQLRSEARRRRVSFVIRERMLTLTVPHIGSATQRVELLYRAWGSGKHSFAETIRELSKAELGARWEKTKDLVHSFRVFEWTEGKRNRKNDGEGHPHFHLWLHGPFLDVDLVRTAWELQVKRAAAELELELAEDFRAIVHVNKARDGIEKEMVKYLVKDLSATSHASFVDARVMADVLLTIDGRRTRQVSKGFKAWEVRPENRDPVTGQIVCSCGCGGLVRYDLTSSHRKLAPRVWVGLPPLEFDGDTPLPVAPPPDELGDELGLSGWWSGEQTALPF